MTYKEIAKALTRDQLSSVNFALDEETEELLTARARRVRRTPTMFKAIREEAEGYFAEEVTQFLRGERELTPQAVLTHRRRTIVAWAIAQLLPPFWKRREKLREAKQAQS